MEFVRVSNLSRIRTISDWMARDFSGFSGQGIGIVIFAISDADMQSASDGILHALDCRTLGAGARDGAWPLGISPGVDSRISDYPLSVGEGILADHRVERSA